MLLEFLLSAFVFTAVFWAGILGLDREGVPRSPPPSIPESILHSTSPLLSLFCLHLRSSSPPSRKRTSYSPSHLWELSLQTLSLSTLCPAHPKAQGAGWNPNPFKRMFAHPPLGRSTFSNLQHYYHEAVCIPSVTVWIASPKFVRWSPNPQYFRI